MMPGFIVGDRVEVISDVRGHRIGALGTIVFIKPKFIYVELDQPPVEPLGIMLIDPETRAPQILSDFTPDQLRHCTILTA